MSEVVYKATLIENGEVNTGNYIGGTSQELKGRVSFHNSCMTRENLEKHSELSKEAHKRRREGRTFTVRWEILERSAKIAPGQAFCRLCVAEMFWILFKRDEKTLNNLRMERCKHINSIFLKNYEDPG